MAYLLLSSSMLKRVFQHGRRRRKTPEAYPLGYVEDVFEPRTTLKPVSACEQKSLRPGQGRRPCELRGTTLIQRRMKSIFTRHPHWIRDADHSGHYHPVVEASQVRLGGEFRRLPAGSHRPPALSVQFASPYYSLVSAQTTLSNLIPAHRLSSPVSQRLLATTVHRRASGPDTA